jgi:transcriptional regulator with XRE-family HTH domain
MAGIPIFGRRVKRVREERGLSPQELATKAGTSYQTIWRIEAGKHAEPGIYIARSIARALGVTLDYLVGMHEDKDSEETPAAAALIGV